VLPLTILLLSRVYYFEIFYFTDMSLNSIATARGSMREYASEERLVNNVSLISECSICPIWDTVTTVSISFYAEDRRCASYSEYGVSPRHSASLIHALYALKHLWDGYYCCSSESICRHRPQFSISGTSGFKGLLWHLISRVMSTYIGPPLWYSGQSSWLQIQRSRV
jgi:hypothetical protein